MGSGSMLGLGGGPESPLFLGSHPCPLAHSALPKAHCETKDLLSKMPTHDEGTLSDHSDRLLKLINVSWPSQV